MIRYFIGGDKSSDRIVLIIEGLVAGIPVDELAIKNDILEFAPNLTPASLHVTMPGGVRRGVTIGGPVTLVIDSSKKNRLDPAYGKVAVGSLCSSFLGNFNVQVSSKCMNPSGIYQIIVKNMPPGLGSYAHYDRRLTAQLCAVLLEIPGAKGAEIGKGFALADCRGSQIHDEIFYDVKKGFYRKTNNAGGLEGGMTNGEDIVLTVAIGKRASLKKTSVIKISGVNGRRFILGEAVVSCELAKSFMQKFGGDSLKETARNYHGYVEQLKKF